MCLFQIFETCKMVTMETKEKTTAFHAYITATADYPIREVTYQGRPHLVVPVVMMVEGVHHGSGGPIFHRSETLRDLPERWNGIPITVNHPEHERLNVSGNSPEIMDEYSVGQVFNTHYDNGLKADAYIDVERIQRISPEALAYIRARRPLDVSVGVFNATEPITGEWGGETYESVAVNYVPDHLALLPEGQGACSWSDGCGIRVNKEGGDAVNDLLKTFKEISQKGYAVALINNEEGYQEISQLLQNALDNMDTNSKKHFLEEVFANDFIYRVRNPEGGSTLYRRGYSVNNGAVSMADGPAEVRKQVSYVTMRMRRTKPSNNNEEGGTTMSDPKSPCCEDKVDRLIANEQTKFTAADKEWLLALNEQQVDKLIPKEPKVQANAAEAIETFKSTLTSLDDYTALMPKEMGEKVKAGVALIQANREALVKSITDNSDKFTKEQLENLSDDVLEGIAETFKSKRTDYSGQGDPPPTVNGDDAEMMLPPEVLAYESQKKEG